PAKFQKALRRWQVIGVSEAPRSWLGRRLVVTVAAAIEHESHEAHAESKAEDNPKRHSHIPRHWHWHVNGIPTHITDVNCSCEQREQDANEDQCSHAWPTAPSSEWVFSLEGQLMRVTRG